MKKYLVIDDTGVDTFTSVYDTLEEANDEAYSSWRHLTKQEQKTRHIYVAYTEDTEEFYDEEALNEEPFDWKMWESLGDIEEAFDSDNKLTHFETKHYPSEFHIYFYSNNGFMFTHRINLNEMFPADDTDAYNWAKVDTEEALDNVESWQYDPDFESDLMFEIEQMWQERISKLSDSCLNCPYLDSACDGADVLSTMPLEHWAEWVNKRKKIEE